MAGFQAGLILIAVAAALSGCGEALYTGGPIGDAGGSFITSPVDPSVRATIPPGVPQNIAFPCSIHGAFVANRRAAPPDTKFQEHAATMYACIAQRMPPAWKGRSAALADVDTLLAQIHVKDPGFAIEPSTGHQTIRYE
jgi:hypothetical protein